MRDKKTKFWFLGLVLIAIALLSFNWLVGLFRQEPDQTAGEVPCIIPGLPIPEGYHIHPHLRIVIDGKNVPVPANIGSGGCEKVMHTHDASGEIHIEPNFYQEFTLGQFFREWEQPLSAALLLDKTADASHEIIMTVDGKPDAEFGNLVLRDGQEIVLEYRPKKD